MLERAGFGRRVVSVLARSVVLALRLLEVLRISPLHRWIRETVTTDSFVSIDKAERALGFVPQYSNRDALPRNYEWYSARRAATRNGSGITHRVPWKQGALSLAKLFRVVVE